MSSNFQKICKNKFGCLKNRGGPQAHLNFSEQKNAAGGVKLPHPIRNRVKKRSLYSRAITAVAQNVILYNYDFMKTKSKP